MNSDIRSRRSDVIAEEAAGYFIALKTPDAKTKTEFADWLKTSPEHVSEFLAVAALWDSLPEMSAQPSPEALIQLAAGEDKVVAISVAGAEQAERTARPAARRPWLWAAGIAAVAVLLVAGVLMLAPPFEDPNLYRTATGEQTSVPLPDGSIVSLNTQSAIRVDYGDAFRAVHLTEGEALFDVAKDPARPFRVVTESAVIQAVGTRFNVRSVAKDITVTVVEGIVDVSAKVSRRPQAKALRAPDAGEPAPPPVAIEPVRLTVGQQARIEPGSDRVAVVDTAIEKAIAWQQRRLVFERLSLQEVIDEFNRYNDPPIVIEDPGLRNLPISGVFRANDRASFAQFLQQMKLAESHTRSDGTIVLRRAARE